MDNQGGRKLRLRRLAPRPVENTNVIKKDVIQKNLEQLKQNIQKKKRAQEAYYQNNVGVSPMFQDDKQPVQQRLGRKVPFMGTNTSMVPPKKRLYKNSTLNNSISKKKSGKRNLAQMRLNKIRERHRYQALMTENNASMTRKIKLHRMVPNIPNFKVQVRNNGDFVNNGIKRHRIILNREIQEVISQIKSMYTGEKLVIFKVTPKATNVSTNDRFSDFI